MRIAGLEPLWDPKRALVGCAGVEGWGFEGGGRGVLGGAKEGGDLPPAALPSLPVPPPRGLRAGLGPKRLYSGFLQWDQLPLGV